MVSSEVVVAPTELAGLGSPSKVVLLKQRKKPSKDLSFPIVYLGFIAGFLALKGDMMLRSLPTLFAGELLPRSQTLYLPLMSLFVVCPILYVWRAITKRYLFSPLAKSFAGLRPGTVKFDKFCEQAWLAMHYTIATATGYFVLRTKPWWPPVFDERAERALSASQHDKEQDHVDVSFQFLYSLQLSFYTLELVTLMLTKNRRSDAVVYFFHHIYTLFLMAGSWVSYCHRIGSLVLFLHDVGDIFLPIGKCFSYAEEHVRQTKSQRAYETHKTVGMTFFVLFVIAFAIPRLILYGLLVFRGFFEHHWYSCCNLDVATNVCLQPCDMAGIWSSSLTAVLGLLYPMHVFWFYLIVKMAVRLIFAKPGEYDDVRSDGEVDDVNSSKSARVD